MAERLRYYKLVERVAPTVSHFCDLMCAKNKTEAAKEAKDRGWNMKTHHVETTTFKEMQLLLNSLKIKRDRVVTTMSNILRYIPFR